MQIILRTARRMSRFVTVEAVLGCIWLVALPLLEIAGRRFKSDVGDGAALVGLLVLMLVTRGVHHSRPSRLIRLCGATIQAVWKQLTRWPTELGVDFTQTPPVSRGLPWTWCGCLALLAVLTPLSAIASPWLPGGAREFLAPRLYLANLLLVGVVWTLLAMSVLVHGVFIWVGIHNWLVTSYERQGPRPFRPEVIVTACMFAVALLAAGILPTWPAVAAQVVFLVTATVALVACSPGLEVIWRYRGCGSVRTFDGRWLVWMQCAGSILITVILALISTGESVWPGAPPVQGAGTAPVTSLLGRSLLWMSVVGNALLLYCLVRLAIQGIRFNPVRMQRRFARQAAATTAPHDRRWEIQQRRRLIRGLQRLFRRAARQKGRRGTGLWFAPQHWYLFGMTRDDEHTVDSETRLVDQVVGLPYHRVFTPEARYHFWVVAQALKVDLIFVENGVEFRRLVGVLRMMFEIYDIYGGRRRAEEMHFTGLPGVRVLFHEFDMCTAAHHNRDRYPEPDYAEVGRARILHVFKDRGESPEDAPVPVADEGISVMSGA